MSRFDSGVIGSYILSMSQFINQVRNFFAILFYGCLMIAAVPAFGVDTNSPMDLATKLTPTMADFGARVDIRAGYGFNIGSGDAMQVAATDVSLSPAMGFGLVVSHDSTGICAGGLTIGIHGSFDLPVLGKIDAFAGDGIAYDFHYNSPANYLFTGFEKPFTIKRFRFSPGVSLANTSTRAGTVIIGGFSCKF